MPNVPLSRGFHAVVDRDDLPTVAVHTWHIASNGQAATNVRKPDGSWVKVYMARLLLEPEARQWVRFLNGDKLDCRRNNLELTTFAQVAATGWRALRSKHSQHKGVTWDKHRKRWIAQLWRDGRNCYLGSFEDETAAAEAFNQASERVGA